MKPPNALPLRTENVPEDLAVFENWLPWRWEVRSSKWTKAPINASTNRRASSTDPSTWSTLDDAVRYARTNVLPGVGFVFTNSPFAGIDLDACRDPETGLIEPWARGVVSDLDSYTEVSPSGTGLKVFVRGTLPSGRRRKGNVEMYDSGRFFTVTGHRLADVTGDVMERSSELFALHLLVFGSPAADASPKARRGCTADLPGGASLDDAELIRRASTATNGAKFARLWEGDASGYATSSNEGKSEADLALCSLLAFWCGPDENRIDALFRRSGLMRPKWDERHYGDGRTYGQGTISKVLSNRSEFFSERPAATSRVYARRKAVISIG